MKVFYLKIVFVFLLIQCKKEEKVLLPEKKITDTYFNQQVTDSYRYMENLSDTTVLNWYKKQTLLTNSKIQKISNRKKLIKLQEELEKKDSNSISLFKITNNNTYFYLKNDNNKIQLYYKKGLEGKAQLLLKPEDIDNYTINYISPSWNGNKIAISITKNDLEIGKIIVLDVLKKERYKETLVNCWPSTLGGIRWLPDNSGFTYEFIPEINKSAKNYLLNTRTLLHKLGQNQSKDKVIFSKENNPEIAFKSEYFPEVSFKNENSKYMFSSVMGVIDYGDFYYAKINEIYAKKITWKPLFKIKDLVKDFYIDGDDIIFLTAKNAKNFKLCKTSLLNPNFKNPEILVAEDSLSVITDFTLTKQGIYFVKTKNGVKAKLFLLNKLNQITKIQLPKESGYITVSSKSSNYSDLWVKTEGWVFENKYYYYNYKSKEFIEQALLSKPENKILQHTIIEEKEIISYDGVKVPLSIIYKKGTKLDGCNRLFIHAYGSFGISLNPSVDNYLLNWINEGGIYAIAHVRGGGEKGNDWYQGGFKKTKPNSWKDLISCTEYLIKNKYTSPKRTVVSSGSGGGIVVGRAITERPDLFAVALVRVGIFNTLRSEFAPNGKNLSEEFGSVKDSLEYKYLYEMDAYQHLKKGVKYPAIYLTGGMNDSRVVVWQPAKFAAKMQQYTASNKPVFLSIDFKGGHGFDASIDKKNIEMANLLSFALWQTGHPDFQI